jgi:energy-converting hydrogenase Eha subunit A
MSISDFAPATQQKVLWIFDQLMGIISGVIQHMIGGKPQITKSSPGKPSAMTAAVLRDGKV